MTVTNLDELRDHWPADDSGRRCKDLLISFLTEKLLATAMGNDCNPVSAPAESAADKCFSVLIRDLRTIGTKAPDRPAMTIKTLNRHVDPSKLEQQNKNES